MDSFWFDLAGFPSHHDDNDDMPMGAPRPPQRDSIAKEDVRYTMQRLDKLTLVCMAMWSIIREDTNRSEEDLMERVRQIDLMDGEEDGKVTRQVAKCSSCHRVMNQRHPRCLYCGQEKLIISAFDAIT